MARHSATVQPNLRPTSRDAGLDVPVAPHLLLAEDDPASCHFIDTALTALGCAVEVCMNGDDAVRVAGGNRFDLMLLDRNIPALSGTAVLRALRDNPQAASRDSPAVATSADWDLASRRAADAAGFAGTLAKPCSVRDLQCLLQDRLPAHMQPLQHDVTALENAGGAANLRALRMLFAAELEQMVAALPELLDEPRTLDGQLHRLQSSAGFCGAPALASAARVLRKQLQAGLDPQLAAPPFQKVLRATRERFADRRACTTTPSTPGCA